MPSLACSLVNATGTLVLGGIVGAAITKAFSDKELGESIIPTDVKQPQKQNNGKWCVKSSIAAKRTLNPVRSIVDSFDISKLGPSEKTLLALGVGDPTIYPALPVCEKAHEALKKVVAEGDKNGCPPTVGYLEVRRAVARKYTELVCQVTENDVFITSGCSDALSLTITSLVSKGENILLPTPGCSTYRSICSLHNITPRFYLLNPKSGWDINLRFLEKQIDSNTKAIVINNPSNPCGSILSRNHMMKLIKLCVKYKVPIIADERYCNLSWSESEFTTFRSLISQETPVPVITISGVSMSYLVPGWRIGWIVVSDPLRVMDECKQGIRNMSQVLLGPNSVCQSALPQLLDEIPESFFREINSILKKHAEFMFDGLMKIRTLTPTKSHGGMYMMVEVELTKLRGIDSTEEFCRRLLLAERVFCLHGELFQAPGFFRVVLCPTLDVLKEALERIESFIMSLYIED